MDSWKLIAAVLRESISESPGRVGKWTGSNWNLELVSDLKRGLGASPLPLSAGQIRSFQFP
eukprot:802460-Prymnesium_polylepis.1